jgi:thiol-disulfide isomerase/thioredoxin
MEPNPPPASPPRPLGVAARAVLIVVTVAALAALLWPRSGGRDRVGGGYLVDESGRPVPLAAELAPVTLLHFWGTWCPPCLREIPELVRYARENSDPALRVLFVAVNDDPAVARRFFGADELPLYFDPMWEVANRYGTDQLPETHVVVGGQVVKSFIGATAWSDPAVRAELQKWTATPASAEP